MRRIYYKYLIYVYFIACGIFYLLTLNKTLVPVDEHSSDPDRCYLPYMDPWHEEIRDFLDPAKPGPFVNCKPMTDITQLVYSSTEKKSYLSIKQEYVNNYSCRYKCLYSKDDYTFREGTWTDIENLIQPPCDVFEVNCYKANQSHVSHRQLFYQIYRPPLLPRNNSAGFSIHMLVLDAVSHSNFVRGLPKLAKLLAEEYEAIPFAHLNKVGSNSMPNGYALLFGKQAERMPASPLNKETVIEDSGFQYNNRCKTPLDKESSFIGFQLRDFGYTTMMAEDWALGLFNHPNCVGFKTTPVDHYMRPLALRHGRMTLTAPKNYGDFVNYERRRCREGYQILLDYLESFVNVYEDIRQKFSITWTTELAHDDLNNIYHGDGNLYEVFEKLKSKMDDAFLIVMSDHGIRIGDHLNTEIGELEGYNPAFFIALPRKLRTNKVLRAILEENSRQLISHHDVYATLMDIGKNSHLWTESYWDSRQWPADNNDRQLNAHMHGSSLLRTLKQPRDCSSLRIPYAYCLCAKPYMEVTNDMALVVRLAHASVDKINEDIRANNFSDKCAKLSLNESEKVTLLETREQDHTTGMTRTRNFKIKFKTQPGGGHFAIKLRLTFDNNGGNKGNIEFTENEFERYNRHGQQSQCAQESKTIHPLCYCKNLL